MHRTVWDALESKISTCPLLIWLSSVCMGIPLRKGETRGRRRVTGRRISMSREETHEDRQALQSNSEEDGRTSTLNTFLVAHPHRKFLIAPVPRLSATGPLIAMWLQHQLSLQCFNPSSRTTHHSRLVNSSQKGVKDSLRRGHCE